MNIFVICSGGLDSVTLAYRIAKEHTLSGLISFDYGQRHSKELDFARACAQDLGAPISVIDISSIGPNLSGSALTDDVDVPEGHYTEDNMKITVVPNRNAIMLSIAYGIAAARGGEAVAAAFHGGDHYIYPDCRPAFVQSFEEMQKHALDGIAEIRLLTPYVDKSKADIAAEAISLGVPVEKTWSCYKGEELHCGRCGTCVARREAFHLAGADDPTPYQDKDFWAEATSVASPAKAGA